MPNVFLAFSQTMPGMPHQAWWLAAVVLFLLVTLAVMDAFTARVPDPLILPSLICIVAVEGYFVSWPFAGWHLLIAFAVGFTLFLINEIWFHLSNRDGFGMGDAKWSMLAVTCFDVRPVVIAWAIGAWLALCWMAITRVVKHPTRRVHFTPFLFAGLLVGIWWVRLSG